MALGCEVCSFHATVRNYIGDRITFPRIAILISVTVCASSVYICHFMSGSEIMNNLLQKSKKLQLQIECFEKDLPADKEKECWMKFGIKQPTRKGHEISSKCLDDGNVENYVKQEIDTKLLIEKENLEKEAGKNGKDELEKIVERCYGNDNRFVVHWFVRDDASTGMTAGNWFTITEFANHGSIYTVSPGYNDTYVNGAVRIPRNGLYMIYGKITPKCIAANKRPKRVYFEIRLREKGRKDSTLLSEVGKKECKMEGDLLTMFQQGLMRLAKGNLVYIRIKFPEDVKLSDTDSWFKNNFGVAWVGLS